MSETHHGKHRRSASRNGSWHVRPAISGPVVSQGVLSVGYQVQGHIHIHVCAWSIFGAKAAWERTRYESVILEVVKVEAATKVQLIWERCELAFLSPSWGGAVSGYLGGQRRPMTTAQQ